MAMTSEAKRALSATIRRLRDHLLVALHDATESTYRLAVPTADAGLGEVARQRRGRFESWLREQLRSQQGRGKAAALRTAEDFRREAEKQAAYTLLNRLVLLRLMEAPDPEGRAPLRKPAVVTGGWDSQGYQDLRQLAPALAQGEPGDDSEGYAFLLRLVFEDLATELPGLYGPAGIAELVPIPTSALRFVVEALDDPELASCWGDDMTLGWVYQYWNDPEREALDAKLNEGGKVEPHEIASKTQMFTERYMVDWLLQNTLGPMWRAICRRHGWTPEAESEGMLERLEQRRQEWRARREAGEVGLTELMPLHSEAERRWAYYVPQPLPDDAVERTPESVRDLKILDPAVGSGHFLVVAMDLLVALYHEEARHRGEAGQPGWSDETIVERVLGHNLHGIDLDPRAVQIAAAALWLKARQLAPGARPERLNLVASNLRLSSLPDDDRALETLRRQVEDETGIPAQLTDTVIQALRGADHLGSLLKVDRAVDEAIAAHESELGRRQKVQLSLLEETPDKPRQPVDRGEAKATLLDRIEAFLGAHSRGDDLGLRLRGAQLAAGVRFVRLVREGHYHLVVANPPYQGTSKMADAQYITQHYKLGKADLYAAFLLRGLELARPGGVSAMLTMRNWMFIKQFAGLRAHLLSQFDLRALGDFDKGAFESMPTSQLISICLTVLRKSNKRDPSCVAIQPTAPGEKFWSRDRTQLKRAAVLCHVGRHVFDPGALKVVPEWPLVYWWTARFLERYSASGHMGATALIRYGLSTQNNMRWLRCVWEVPFGSTMLKDFSEPLGWNGSDWVPYIKGAAGAAWMDAVSDVVLWRLAGAELWAYPGNRWGRGTALYFHRGVAFVNIGASFSARAYRLQSIFGHVAGSVFGVPTSEAVCLLNSKLSRFVIESLNPTVHFLTSDVERLPLSAIANDQEILGNIEQAFTTHEAHREPSVEFKQPGPSPWRHAQEWAQEAVDRPEGAPLPEYVPALDPEPASDHLSFALGVALGRFGPGGEGILDPSSDDLSHALPSGLLFLDRTLDPDHHADSLGHPAAKVLLDAWEKHGPRVDTQRKNLRDWLALDFFNSVHRGMYENRPIHWPLSSEKRTFVAWINIHRLGEDPLHLLLADHLHPTLTRFEGRLTDLRAQRDSDDKKAAREAENRFAQLKKERDELSTFIADLEQAADHGPPPTGPGCPEREIDARYLPDLDDGVMINSAPLWKLLQPQWKDPEKWWLQIATASPKGNKDCDWSHLALRYWPTRVDEKCRHDPSLGVAHGCFWRYHPERAWAWELRLQDEIGPDFRIEEPPYRPGDRDLGDGGDAPHRRAWLRDHPELALAGVEKEALRRMGRGKDSKTVPEMHLLESGLWSALPADVWALELRLATKQKSDFHLRAPDEPEARATYESAHRAKVEARRQLVASFAPQAKLFDPPSDPDTSAAAKSATATSTEAHPTEPEESPA